MFKKATFALAGMLAMVAAAAIPTTAGAADTDAALVDNVRLFETQAFLGEKEEATADGTCKAVTVGARNEAKSAELINQPADTTLRVQLFKGTDCSTANFVAELNSLNPKDAGLTWSAAVKHYKTV